MTFRYVVGLALSLALVATPAAAQTSPKDRITVNIGGPSAGYFLTYVAYDLGIYQKHGLEPKLHLFTSGSPLLAAL